MTTPAQKLAELRASCDLIGTTEGIAKATANVHAYAFAHAPAIAQHERELEEERRRLAVLLGCKVANVTRIVEELCDSHDRQADQLAAKDAEIAKLRAALKPSEATDDR